MLFMKPLAQFGDLAKCVVEEEGLSCANVKVKLCQQKQRQQKHSMALGTSARVSPKCANSQRETEERRDRGKRREMERSQEILSCAKQCELKT